MKIWQKIIAVISTFALLFNSIAAPLSILAQETTPEPTPEATAQPDSTAIPEATVEVTATPEVTLDVTPEEIATPTPEVTAIATDLVTPIPSDQPVITQAPESNPTTAGPPASEQPTSTPTFSPEPQIENATVTTTVVSTNIFPSTVQNDLFKLITDKLDYSPTEVAIISGSNFAPTKTYSLTVSSTDDPTTSTTVDVTTDGSGNFTYNYQLDGNYRPNYKVEVKDLDKIIATATFTDNIVGYVSTNTATNLTSNNATLNGHNWGVAATGHSFWVSSASFSTTSPTIPAGVYSTPDLGFIAANTDFSASLASITTTGVPTNLPAITPNTTYYFAAWSLVSGTWYPGAILTFTTALQPGTITVDKVTNPSQSSQVFQFYLRRLSPEPVVILNIFTLTDQAAPYVNSTIVPGSYSLSEDTVQGWQRSSPVCYKNGGISPIQLASGSQAFDVAAGDSIVCTFNNIQYGSITAYKYLDTNENGINDTGETPLSGWRINLYTATDSQCADPDPSAALLTGSDGNAVFNSIVPGTYYLKEETRSGWATKQSPCRQITVSSGQNALMEFGNYQPDTTPPVDGVCDPAANGNNFYSRPTSLCSVGDPVSIIGNGPWTWTCNGVDGGNPNPNCSANLIIDGVCGAAAKNYAYDAQNFTGDLCAKGEADSSPAFPTFGNPSTWVCKANLPEGADSETCTASVDSTPTAVPGCTDPNASNQNPLATVDDGSCIETPFCEDGSLSIISGQCVNEPVPTICADGSSIDDSGMCTSDDGTQIPAVCPDGTSPVGNSQIECETVFGPPTCSQGYHLNGNGDQCVADDTTAPTAPKALPAGGNYYSDQTVSLIAEVGADIRYTTNGVAPTGSTGTLYTGGFTIGIDTVLKAVAIDAAGNVSPVMTETYAVAPTIYSEGSSSVTSDSVTITWTTDDSSTSRVVYDTVSHSSLGDGVNYGYANSTLEDVTKVTSHSVTITGLTSGTTYYYRVISHGSPEAVGNELSFKTSIVTTTPTSNGDNGGNASAPVCSDTKPGSTPTLLSAIAGLVNSIKLTWSKATNPVSYYLVAYGLSSGAQQFGNPNVGGSDTTTYTVSGLSGGVRYYFKVRAGNGCTPGEYSNELSAIPSGSAVSGLPSGFAPGVLGEETSANPSPSPEVLAATQGTSTNPGLLNWILTHKKISGGVSLLLLLIAYGLYRASRKNK